MIQRCWSLLLVVCFLTIPLPLWADEPAQEPSAVAATLSASQSQAPAHLQSPRATMKTFLDAMARVKSGDSAPLDRAIETLELDDLNPMIRKERGTDLSWMLINVFDKTQLIMPEQLPDWTEGDPYVFHEYPEGSIVIHRVQDGRWLFSKESLDVLPKIQVSLEDEPTVIGVQEEDSAAMPFHLKIRRQLSAGWKAQSFLIENWQWLGLLAIIAVGLVADKLLALLLMLGLRHWKSRTGLEGFRSLSDNILRPWGLMLMAVIWWLGINLMGLPEQALLILLVAVKFLAAFSAVWAAYRLVDVLAAQLLARAERSESKVDDVLFPLIPKTLKIFITVIGGVFIADNMNIDVTSLLAGLGLAGMAFALAAKDLVQNLFGSVTVLMDRTFSVGDWIKVDGVEGTVESIGFRSTRVRTFYNSRITVPNAKFITASVDNMGERTYRRYTAHLGLTYDTPADRIEAFCEGIRELVRQHPYMRKDYFHVYFNGYGPSSLDILVYVFWRVPNWGTELRERHRFLLDILRLAHNLGVDFAFPTQTLYMQRDSDGGGVSEDWQQEEALSQGRNQARGIVENTLGLGHRPPPAAF